MGASRSARCGVHERTAPQSKWHARDVGRVHGGHGRPKYVELPADARPCAPGYPIRRAPPPLHRDRASPGCTTRAHGLVGSGRTTNINKAHHLPLRPPRTGRPGRLGARWLEQHEHIEETSRRWVRRGRQPQRRAPQRDPRVDERGATAEERARSWRSTIRSGSASASSRWRRSHPTSSPSRGARLGPPREAPAAHNDPRRLLVLCRLPYRPDRMHRGRAPRCSAASSWTEQPLQPAVLAHQAIRRLVPPCASASAGWVRRCCPWVRPQSVSVARCASSAVGHCISTLGAQWEPAILSVRLAGLSSVCAAHAFEEHRVHQPSRRARSELRVAAGR